MAKLISRLMRSMIAYVQRNDLSQTLSDGEGDACAIAPEMPALCRAAAAEGAVLLKNDGALPIRAGETVALFGRCASDYFYVGYGSGGDVVKPYAVSLTEGLRQNGIKLNERLLAAYETWRAVPKNEPDEGWWGHWPRCYSEMDVPEALVYEAARESALALVVIGRAAGEDRENLLRRGSYYLTRTEERLLRRVTAAFDRVAVAIDAGNAMDLSWLENEKIGAALLLWQGGMESGNAAADVLCGRVNPSGRLPMSIARRYADYPSAKHFGRKRFNNYAEDIYVGYRYFETFRPDAAQYPFGFGLSYTQFSIEAEEMQTDGETLRIGARVTNTGAYAGREVVELFAEPPQGRLGKPARALAAFAKTRLLEPGETERLELSCKTETFASFDDSGASGFQNAWVLEAGTYAFWLGENVRSAARAGEMQIGETRLVSALAPRLPIQPGKGFDRLVNRGGPAYERTPDAENGARDAILAALPAPVPQTGDLGIRLSDVAEGRAALDAFIAQLSLDELEAITRGEGPMNSTFGMRGNAGMFGGVLASLREKGVPPVITTDGPAGIRLKATCSLLPCGTCLAATWDTALVAKLYAAVGDEMLARRTDVLLGPGLNIQRNPLCGRNFEYFSEDPLLSGKMAAAVVSGVQHDGLSACPKHFACNNQETNRNRTDVRVSARALREIYLKGFEICVKEAPPLNLMTSYNQINGVWSHYSYDLAERILRGEWGYDGNVLTDWWMQYASSAEFPALYGNGCRVRAHVNVLMPGGRNSTDHSRASDGTLLATYQKPDGITLGEMQLAARDVLKMALRSSAMRRLQRDAQGTEKN